MLNDDKETGNKQEYEKLPYFSFFLMPHWKYDVFAKECDIYRYVMLREYAFFYKDKDGNEFEITELNLENSPNYYYIKIHDSKSYVGISSEEIIMTYSDLDKEIQSDFGLVLLENGEKFISKYYSEEKIHMEDYIDETGFFIHKHFSLDLKDVEAEKSYYDELEIIEDKYKK